MLALCLMLSGTYYAHNYASIIGWCLSVVVELVERSTTTIDDMAEATEETPPPPLQSKEKVQSKQSIDDQGMY